METVTGVVDIVIPTIFPRSARAVAKEAKAKAGCDVEVFVVFDEEKSGYPIAVNQGLTKSRGGHVCLLDDDARPLTQGWLVVMLREMERRSKIGFVGPSGLCRTMPQKHGRRRDRRRPRTVDRLAGFCLLVNQAVISAVGGMDEGYMLYGADIDWQWRARHLGWRSLWVPGVFCVHSQREPMQPQWDQDFARFREKWGIGNDC